MTCRFVPPPFDNRNVAFVALTGYTVTSPFAESGFAPVTLNFQFPGHFDEGQFALVAPGNTPAGSAVTVSLPPVTVAFAHVTQAGNTAVATSSTGPPAPPGFVIALGAAYYTVSTTAIFDTAVVCITDSSINSNSALIHYNNPPPPIVGMDVANSIIGTTICSIPLTSLSPFVVAQPVTVVAIDHAYSTAFNTALAVAAPGLLSGDSGAGISVTAHSAPGHGALNPFGTDGSFTYTPNAGFTGTDTFTYTITDATAQTATAGVTITVALPAPPVANNQAYSTAFNTALAVAAPGLLSGSSGAGVTVTAHSAPGHGTLSPFGTDGSFTYTPTAGFTGTDAFTYTITDAAAQTATAGVTITVARPPFLIPAGATASFTNVQFGACNSLSWGYQLGGGSNQVQASFPGGCGSRTAPDVTIGPFATPMALRVFLTDNHCSFTYYSDGTPVDHVIVEGSNPYSLRFADAGGFCEKKTTTLNNFAGFNFHVDLTIEQPITATGTSVSTAEGQAFSGTVAGFSDADPNSTAAEYSATINWGDGSAAAGTVSGGGLFVVSGTHTYAEEGPYHVTVTVIDTDNPSNTATANSTANVADAALTGQPVCPATIQPNFASPTATFTDAIPGAHLEDFSAVINWGDGSSSPGVISGTNPYTVSGTHTYTVGGPHTIVTTILDVGGRTLTLSCRTTVSCDQQGDNQGQFQCNDSGKCDSEMQAATENHAHADNRATAMKQDREEDANEESDSGNASCEHDGQDQGGTHEGGRQGDGEASELRLNRHQRD